METRAFIHFAGKIALLVLVTNQTFAAVAQTAAQRHQSHGGSPLSFHLPSDRVPLSGLVLSADDQWSIALADVCIAHDLDLDDLMPSPGAINSPNAPTWAEVPADLVVELYLGLTATDGLHIAPLPQAGVTARGALYAVAGDICVRVPPDLMTPRCRAISAANFAGAA